MRATEVLVDGFGRVREEAHAVLDGLDPELLTAQLQGGNPIGWLVWHLARVQDAQVAPVVDGPQVWLDSGWSERADLPYDPGESGYGQSAEQVAAFPAVPAELLLGYLDAVHERTVQVLGGLSDDDLGRVLDASYDPPVTVAARLVSILADDLQHVGQAAFLRGMLERA